ncbi:S1 family peptidase [Streptomyces sp. CRN 30]|uniref:S1 family peptidase n=1 Tax=Streptomyces sp. CRN 30 TaxID=3075613 RepID=UPI002A7F8F3F|nr:S1 family peptidase [Streptomyces sp. CRN 30]
MSHKRTPKRKAVIAAGSVAALGAAAFLLPNAMAGQTDDDNGATPRTFTAADVPDLVAQLAPRLGDAFAGSYYEASGQRIVVNVVGDDSDVIDEVEKAGAVPHQVRNSTAALDSAATTLRTDATIPGTAWSVDPKTNEIRVTADSTVTGDAWNRLESTVASLGEGVATVKRSAGTFKTFAEGGDAIFGGGARCSLGFNVTDAQGAPAFLTAGHCGVAAAQWSEEQNGAPVGTVDQAVFPGAGDFALVTYDDPATRAASAVDTGDGQLVEIAQAAEAVIGQPVIRMGSTTGLSDGQVLGLNATVNYPEGTVTGLIQTDVCAEPGDSGGSLFTADGGAIGLTSGGSGDCTVGGETFFQPVTTALEAVGATLGAGDAAGGGEEAGGGDAGVGDGAGAGDEAGAGDQAGEGIGGGDGVGGGVDDGMDNGMGDGTGDGVDDGANDGMNTGGH